MSTKDRYLRKNINSSSKYFTCIRSIIETAFHSNSVSSITSLKEAYKLAKTCPSTVVTDMPIYHPEEIGLAEDAKILLHNDGAVHGRCASARRINSEIKDEVESYQNILKEAVYNIQKNNSYHAQCFIGLDESFMVRARLLIPVGHENILYNWLLNFQPITQEYIKIYNRSRELEEGDILIISDPDWKHPDYPYGLSFFDPDSNCAAILGMRYFGEFKKGTLTLAWGIANRNGYAACHGGLKRYQISENKTHVMSIFGLSGSGKSTLTHAKHENKYNVSVLHDDALIISTVNGESIALEPSYFDKTGDYPLISEDNKFLLSVQNCGITIDDEGNKVVVSEDIRNGNGRAIKSKLWSDNRVDKVGEKLDTIIWLMKDPALPPVIKITKPVLASTMGALLATKRTSAERQVTGMNISKLVIEPYANPFRTYDLSEDYNKFKKIFEELETECYIMNTGYFLDHKVTKEMTISFMEQIVEGKALFEKWEKLPNMELMKMDDSKFVPDMNDEIYIDVLYEAFNKRIEYIKVNNESASSYNRLPEEALLEIEALLEALKHR